MNEGNRSQISAAVLDEWEVYCYSDSLSERGLRDRFARHGLTPGKCHNRLIHYIFFDDIFRNERVTEGIFQCLLEYFPDAITHFDEDGLSPFYFACLGACSSKNTTLSFIQLIVDAAPDSVRSVNSEGCTPLHYLCENDQVDEPNALEILNLLLDKYLEAASHADDCGCLPIHYACKWRSSEFCQVLIKTAPDSVRSVDIGGWTTLHYFCCYRSDMDDTAAMQVLILLIEIYPEAVRHVNNEGKLPLHYACSRGCLATVEYMYDIYPDAIIHATTRGHYPIHLAIASVKCRENPAIAAEIVPFLLNCDPNQKLIQLRGRSLLRYACQIMRYGSNIETAIQVIGCLFDAHPEAIEDDEFAADTNRYHPHVQSFINNELVYARQANDHRLMMTPDDNGQLPLHTALQNNVRLGSIKLLVNGNPSAVRAVDRQGNTALHYACRRAKHDMIALLLAKSFVSRRNAHDKLPIHLLWESKVSDRESIEYTESIFRLLRADPEMINQ